MRKSDFKETAGFPVWECEDQIGAGTSSGTQRDSSVADPVLRRPWPLPSGTQNGPTSCHRGDAGSE